MVTSKLVKPHTPHPTPHTPHPAPRKNFLPQTLFILPSPLSLLPFPLSLLCNNYSQPEVHWANIILCAFCQKNFFFAIKLHKKKIIVAREID
ncbi:hypothetical protein [Microcystis sp. LE19-59.1C]|uniref:hypothetical protein n=1 Tax=Microcystis sp. LE19-59.1C TaxID=3016442 RepID=UPI00258B09E2|nr:hypothetical protein [Microcystis sp. LE19-59.1C]